MGGSPAKPVDVDLRRYARHWYQIKATPQFWDALFAPAVPTDATANYELCFHDNVPTFSVRNEFRVNGAQYYASGALLLPPDAVQSALLGAPVPGAFKVQFTKTNLASGVQPVPAPYYVVALADDYRYAVVVNDLASPTAVWLLSADPTIDEKDLALLRETLPPLVVAALNKAPYTQQQGIAQPVHTTLVLRA